MIKLFLESLRVYKQVSKDLGKIYKSIKELPMSKCAECIYYKSKSGKHICCVDNSFISQRSFNDNRDCNCFIYKDKLEVVNTQTKIKDLTSAMCSLLQDKNKKYGDSALNGVKVFSAIKPESSICIRLDDKLARIRNGEKGTFKKNDLCDIIGYMVLLCIEEGVTAEDIEGMKD